MQVNKCNYFICPYCECSLELKCEDTVGDIATGKFICNKCNRSYDIINGIPRFVDNNNYTSSFGIQWERHSKTQLDKFNGTTISRDRFYKETKLKSSELCGKKILECGSGAGRFTQVILDAGALCFSFDYSTAIEVNQKNNSPNDNLILAQADIYHIPFKKSTFDYIFCLGVIQHTPNPRKALLSMVPYLKDGGKIVIDAYTKSFKALVHPKYALRTLSRKISQEKLYKIIKINAPYLLYISCAVKKIPLIGELLSKFIPIANYKDIFPLSNDMLLEWAILDTFDWLSPTYDYPQTRYSLKKYLLETGLVNIEIDYKNGLVARGTTPLKNKRQSSDI